jgi:hypothetical protein
MWSADESSAALAGERIPKDVAGPLFGEKVKPTMAVPHTTTVSTIQFQLDMAVFPLCISFYSVPPRERLKVSSTYPFDVTKRAGAFSASGSI